VLRHHDYLPFGEEYHPAGWVPENPPAERKLFTGQERDVELGLDYFGARYYRADLGRFSTPEPSPLHALRLVSPQRLNSYGYGNANPLTFADQDGRDAMAVNYSQGALVSGVHFGHNGLAAVDSSGQVLFSDFGPKSRGKAFDDGVVNSPTLSSKIQFDANGLPTRESLIAVAHELEVLETAPPGSVRLAYFKTSNAETTRLINWIRQSKLYWQYSWTGKFSVWGQNCGDYTRAGLGMNVPTGSFPNLDFFVYRIFADEVLGPVVKADVTTQITSFRYKPQ
jgi:RHS repeat-associated protein